jgi:vacuolar iron transporter family protein
MAFCQSKHTRKLATMRALDSSTPLLREPQSEIPDVQTRLTRRESKRDVEHRESHSNHGDILRDIIIGFADGLTVPFALTAGLSSYVSRFRSFIFAFNSNLMLVSLGSSKLVIIGGLAELFSGAISMGLGAYLAAVTERDHYICEEEREGREVEERPEDEREEIYEILGEYGVEREKTRPFVEGLIEDKKMWIKVRE